MWLTRIDGAAILGDAVDVALALLAKGGVADREHFVEDQDVRLQERGDREGEAHIHAAGVALDRRVDEALDAGEIDDVVKLGADVGLAETEQGARHEHILAPGHIGVKAGADFEQGAHLATKKGSTRGRIGDAGENLQERALARPVATDQPDQLASLDLEVDILQRPEVILLIVPAGKLGVLLPVMADIVPKVTLFTTFGDEVALADTLAADGDVVRGHRRSHAHRVKVTRATASIAVTSRMAAGKAAVSVSGWSRSSQRKSSSAQYIGFS